MNDDLPTPALQSRVAGGAAKIRGTLSHFGAMTDRNTNNNTDDNFSPLDAVSVVPSAENGFGFQVNSDVAQRAGAMAAAGAANSYLQQKTFGLVGLGGGDNGAGGLTIAGMAPSEVTQQNMSTLGGGTANNFLRAKTGGIVSFDSDAGAANGDGGGFMGGIRVGGTAAADFGRDPSTAASSAANTILQSKTGGALSTEGGGLTLGGVNAAGALTRGMDPISGAIAAGAANMLLSEKTGGMVSLNAQGSLTLKPNEAIDRRMQEARATATVAGTTLGNAAFGSVGATAGAAALALGGGGAREGKDREMTAINVEGINNNTNTNAGGGGGFNGGNGGAVLDVVRNEFQSRWARAVEEEEKLRIQSLDVDRRERQLAMRTTKQSPNFPPCRLLCLGPVVHHDIGGCIPQSRHTFVKACYGTFYGTVLMLIANMTLIAVNIGTCGREKLANGDDTLFLKHLILPILYLALGGVGAFFVWYYPVYSALGSGSSIQYIMAFIGLFVAFAFAVFQAVGPEGYGGAGFLYAVISADRCGSANFFMILPVAILWACLAVCMFAYMVRLRTFFKEDQASLDAAREQLKSQMR